MNKDYIASVLSACEDSLGFALKDVDTPSSSRELISTVKETVGLLSHIILTEYINN